MLKKYSKRGNWLMLVLLIGIHAGAQSPAGPYKLSINLDIPIAANSLTLLGTSYLIGIARPIPNPESLNTLNRTDVIKFDRGATYQNSKACAYISDAALFASTGLPLLQLISKNSRKDFGTVAAISAETFTLNLAITNLFKETVRRKRPLLYNPDIPVEKKYKKDNFKSFFSGHTSTVACMSYSFAEMYAAYNPKSKLKPMVWSLSAVFPLVTGILRYKAGKHYWTDVITGYIAGAICGLAVPYLHRNSLGFNR